jgi:CheY-like chemotaxis protein
MACPDKKVLVVEDNDHWRKLLVMVIQRSGYQALQAVTGIEAMEIAAATLPDLILMDLGLPKMNGDEATAILKRNPATKNIPIVIQTAYAHTESAVMAGAEEILQKPIELSEIQRVLCKYLGEEAKTPPAGDSPPQDSSSTLPAREAPDPKSNRGARPSPAD